MHIGQKRLTFAYTISELKKLLQVDEKKYTNFYDFNINVLSKAHKEITDLNIDNILFDYNTGNKQRGVEKIYFTIHTAFTNSEFEKNEFLEAVSINPKAVLSQVETIIDTQYNFRANHKKVIMEDNEMLDKFITLHIEFENGLHSNVKNKTAYILTCLNLVKKKA
jgi:hypothetical protein